MFTHLKSTITEQFVFLILTSLGQNTSSIFYLSLFVSSELPHKIFWKNPIDKILFQTGLHPLKLIGDLRPPPLPKDTGDDLNISPTRKLHVIEWSITIWDFYKDFLVVDD